MAELGFYIVTSGRHEGERGHAILIYHDHKHSGSSDDLIFIRAERDGKQIACFSREVVKVVRRPLLWRIADKAKGSVLLEMQYGENGGSEKKSYWIKVRDAADAYRKYAAVQRSYCPFIQ